MTPDDDRSGPDEADRVVRVIDASGGIAGPYCAKVLADAGAEVFKVGAGDVRDPWSIRSSGLRDHLDLAKRPINGELAHAATGADIVVAGLDCDVVGLRAAHPSLVVVTVTPFGTDGPWRDRAASEFTLQAAVGSTGQRGLPEDVPLAAGGRLGEWITGTYAAVGALAALRRRRRTGVGAHVDVSMLDAMATTMVTYPSVFADFAGRPPVTGPPRFFETPSVEPTSDGYIVVTTNSAAQFSDFLVMIDHAELLDDPELRVHANRFARRAEFEGMVQKWTTAHTTAEVLEIAGAFRIPSGPVLNGQSVLEFEPFVEREVFSPAPSDAYMRPRVPYRIGDGTDAPHRLPSAGSVAAPLLRLPSGKRDRPSDETVDDETARPLHGLRVLDCTAWWAGPIAPHALGALGADVIKVEAPARPDLMRYTSVKPPTEPQWWEWGPMFHAVNTNKRGVTLDLSIDEGRDLFLELAATADVVVENYTPRVMENFGLDWERLQEVNPRLVMVRMPAFGLIGPWRDRTGFAQTMESITGLAWLTGHATEPPTLVRGACDPVAGMHAVVATILALEERDRTGRGRFVEVTMAEAALNVAAEQVIEYTSTGRVLTRDGNRGPDAAPQGVYRCAGDDDWIALAVRDDADWHSLCRAINRPDLAADPRFADEAGRRASHDSLDEELTAWTDARSAEACVAEVQVQGVPAEVVIHPRDVAANEQLDHRQMFEVEHHPVTGDHAVPLLPFRLSGVDHWLRLPAPTLGQHNDEVLGSVGVDAARLAALRETGVIGDRPTGT